MLIKNRPSGTFVNIVNGKLVIKNQTTGEPEQFESLKGQIYKVEFIEDEYKGDKYEKLKLYIRDAMDNYILQMKTDSGYFRGFCNSLKSGFPTQELVITPSSKLGDNGKPQTTCFIQQNGKYLKHFFTKDFKGDDKDRLPDLEKMDFKGTTIFDNSKQIAYWKNWLNSKFEKETELTNEPPAELFENDDDLPF